MSEKFQVSFIVEEVRRKRPKESESYLERNRGCV